MQHEGDMRGFRVLSIPKSAHPLVRILFKEMNHQQIGVLDMSERSGVNKNTISGWRKKSVPNIINLSACFSVLKIELKPQKVGD